MRNVTLMCHRKRYIARIFDCPKTVGIDGVGCERKNCGWDNEKCSSWEARGLNGYYNDIANLDCWYYVGGHSEELDFVACPTVPTSRPR